MKSRKKSGIQEALKNDLEDNPFKDIDLIETADEVSDNLLVISKMHISQQNLDDDDSDWEDDDGNIFDVFIEDDEGDDWTRYKLTVFIFAISQLFYCKIFWRRKVETFFC